MKSAIETYSTLPLLNMEFISTRPKGKSDDLKDKLSSLGADLIEFPMIEIQEKKLTKDEELILLNLQEFSHLVFTSANAVNIFIKNIHRLKIDLNRLSRLVVASIGPKTTEALEQKGIQVDLKEAATTGLEFAEILATKLKGQENNILWPTGELAPNHLPNTLKTIAPIKRINIYNTLCPENTDSNLINKIINNQYSAIILTSPSTFYHLLEVMKDKIITSSLKLICIGLTTAKAVKEAHIEPLAIASKPSSEGILSTIIENQKIFNNSKNYRL
ncbi:uroporphyrinogen-III synthase [Puteibacter caeruleilacunae]|nr:uroporphyrinogen-III synthase [Puteibacter caeruleilacunae]